MNEERIALLKTASISQLAKEIKIDWQNMSPHARPYVDAMSTMETIRSAFYMDSGTEIVARFLCNAQPWRGDTARAVKKELNTRLKEAYKKESK